MLNYLWGAMLLVGVVYGAFQGRLPELTTAALDSAKDAVGLCITMTGVMSLWVGLMEIAQKSGMIRQAAGKLQPFISFMFPGIPKGHKAREYITTNIIANIFGLVESHGSLGGTGGGAKDRRRLTGRRQSYPAACTQGYGQQ